MRQIAFLSILLAASSTAGFYLYQQLYGPRDPAMPAAIAGPIPEPPPSVNAGLVDRVPEFALPDMDGVTRSIREWDDQPLLINFWATWCPPCREEMPLLIELQREFTDIDLQVIGIAIDEITPVRRFAEQIGVNYPILVGEQGALDVAASLGLDVVGLPITVFTRADGSVLEVHQGELHRDDALAILGRISQK